MLKLKCLGVILLLTCSLHVALADEAAIKQIVESRMEGLPVDSVHKTPFFGLYEVHAGGDVFYTDEAVTFIFVGKVLDGRTLENLTEMRSGKINAIPFDQLPLDLAIVTVKGKGTRKLAYFADPLCSYCRLLDAEFVKLDDVTIYIFPYPILSQNSVTLSQAAICSPNPAKAWADMMTAGTEPKGKPRCKAPQLVPIVAFARERKIKATPTLIFENGIRVQRALSAAMLDRLLTDAHIKVVESKAGTVP